MAAGKKKKKAVNRGAPEKAEGEKINAYHYKNAQWDRLLEEANTRQMSVFALLRMIVDWFFTAIDTGRADVSTSALFDDVLIDPKVGE